MRRNRGEMVEKGSRWEKSKREKGGKWFLKGMKSGKRYEFETRKLLFEDDDENDDDDEEQYQYTDDDHELDVLPPHLLLHLCGVVLEHGSLVS